MIDPAVKMISTEMMKLGPDQQKNTTFHSSSEEFLGEEVRDQLRRFGCDDDGDEQVTVGNSAASAVPRRSFGRPLRSSS